MEHQSIAILLELLGFLGGGLILAVKVGGTIKELNSSISHLSSNIGDLKTWINNINVKVEGHSDRLARVETHITMNESAKICSHLE